MSEDTAPPPSGATAAGRRLAAPLGVLAAVLAAFAAVAAVDPNRPGHYPVCPLLRHTGILCPGCGGLRGAHALAHGHPLTALGANALAFAGYLAFAAFWTVWLLRSATGRPAPAPRLTAARGWALAALVLVFTVVRNLPAGRALAP
ncbi:DUF2752 domain-containing protein [Streptomyces palmae]|uniref:DUF2752 domain-containing protein n=1 Tax=Streptomyces palmae TaxID=1701085 RepID=A0A4Z0HA44_9ACTN|nr:DUF2752 domain-containing protein [Streptomyces palmae]TGB14769.1 DUF2752 domain-containing protein [Streptomyces palmae]